MSYPPEPEASATPAQDQAMERAYEILGEHFDGVLIVVCVESNTQPNQSSTAVSWKGGCMTALGLATYAQHKMLTDNRKASDGENEGDE